MVPANALRRRSGVRWGQLGIDAVSSSMAGTGTSDRRGACGAHRVAGPARSADSARRRARSGLRCVCRHVGSAEHRPHTVERVYCDARSSDLGVTRRHGGLRGESLRGAVATGRGDCGRCLRELLRRAQGRGQSGTSIHRAQHDLHPRDPLRCLQVG